VVIFEEVLGAVCAHSMAGTATNRKASKARVRIGLE
jgi:hypothetical protein